MEDILKQRYLCAGAYIGYTEFTEVVFLDTKSTQAKKDYVQNVYGATLNVERFAEDFVKVLKQHLTSYLDSIKFNSITIASPGDDTDLAQAIKVAVHAQLDMEGDGKILRRTEDCECYPEAKMYHLLFYENKSKKELEKFSRVIIYADMTCFSYVEHPDVSCWKKSIGPIFDPASSVSVGINAISYYQGKRESTKKEDIKSVKAFEQKILEFFSIDQTKFAAFDLNIKAFREIMPKPHSSRENNQDAWLLAPDIGKFATDVLYKNVSSKSVDIFTKKAFEEFANELRAYLLHAVSVVTPKAINITCIGRMWDIAIQKELISLKKPVSSNTCAIKKVKYSWERSTNENINNPAYAAASLSLMRKAGRFHKVSKVKRNVHKHRDMLALAPTTENI